MAPSSLTPDFVLKDYPHHLTKYEENKGTSKIPIFKLFNEMRKIWKCSLGFSRIPIFHLFYELGKTWKYTQPKNQHFKIQILNLWMNCENKMGNSHKKRWSRFKLNINDWDIPFLKTLRIYQWIGNFQFGKTEKTNWEFCQYHRMFVQKKPWTYIFLAYVYKSIALVNELKRLNC